MIPVAYNLRNLAVRKTTTIATAVGLGLVVFVFASSLMLAKSVEQTLGRSARADVAIVLRKGSDAEMMSGIEEQQIGLILSNADVAKRSDGKPEGVGEIVAVILLDKLGTDGISNVQVRGVPDDAMAFRPSARIIEGRPAQPGTDEAIVGKQIYQRFKGLSLGGTFELRKNRPVKVVGVFEDGSSSFESEVWADLHTVGAAFGRNGSVSSVRAKLTSPEKFAAFEASIEQNRQLGMDVMRESDYYEKQSEGTSIFIKVLGILIVVFFSVGAMIGAMITMHASIASRQREIGTLRALGFSRSSILLSFLLESVLLAGIGGAVGAAASLAMRLVKFSTINFASFSEVVFTFEPTPAIMIASVMLAVFMGLVGGFFPAVRAARMNPIQAMRG
jgi:putative ABC transport system permease protein